MLQKETCGALRNVQAPKMYGFGPEDRIVLVQSGYVRVLGVGGVLFKGFRV